MEDLAPPSDPKRARAQAHTTKNQTSEANLHMDRESLSEDFVKLCPKSKRIRGYDRTLALAHKATDLSIEVLKGNGKLIPQVTKLWVERYEKGPEPAMVELLTMLFESCGAKYHIKEGVLGEISVKDVLIALESLAVTGKVEDYQNSERKEFQNFKDNLESFWDNLVRECQHGPLFDQVLFKECMAYIIPLSCTPTTVYRQVASMIGLQLVTSFIAIAKMLSAQCEATRRQLDAEKKKQTEGPCLESPNKRFSTTHEQITVLEQMMLKIYEGLFVKSHQDLDPNIRTLSIQSLGKWILSYTSMFLKSKYVKYLGWALNDKNAGVRKASILALQNLYELHGNLPIMSEFSAKYSKRMIDLAEDIDVSVAVCAIRFVNQLLRQQIISDTTVALDLLELATDDPPQIRRAIGELFYDYVIGQKLYTSQSGTIVECSPSPEVHLIKMLRLLEAFSMDPILRIYLIDDAWEYMEAMKDWECIISLLLNENPLIEFLDDGATKLLWLPCASVRKAVGERILPATNNRKQYYTKAQKVVFENNRKDITVAMMENYPLLLHKFMADKGKVSSLVEIVLHTDLGLYSSMRQEESFKSVLQLVRVAFFTHGEKEALRSCVRAIDFCSTKSKGELRDIASNEFKELEDELIAKLNAEIKEVVDGGDGHSLLVNLKRLYELQLLRDVSIESLYEDMVMVLSSFRNMADEVVSFLLLNMYLHLVRCLDSIVTSKNVTEALSSLLLSKRNTFFEQLYYFLDNFSEVEAVGKHGNHLARRVCVILAEAWFLFRKTYYTSPNLERLGYCPEASILRKFNKVCGHQLNISDGEDEDVNKDYIEETNIVAVKNAKEKMLRLKIKF